MKSIISSSLIIIIIINLSYGYINYISYDINCKQPTSGISFGLKEFNCMINGTSNILPESTSLFTFEIYGENTVNLTTHHSLYCDYPVYSKLFTLDECSTYDYSNSNYLVTSTDVIPNIPNGSFIIKEYGSSCDDISSYWYATNGTTTQDHNTGINTTYLCVNGNPIQNICQRGSCKSISSLKECSQLSLVSVECS